MKLIKSNQGSLPIMIVLILSLMVVVTVQFTKASRLDKLSIISESEKLKSDMIVEHALTAMTKELSEFYNKKYDEDILNNTGFHRTINIPSKEAKEVSYNYKFTTADNIVGSPEYKFKLRTKVDDSNFQYYDYKFYDMKTNDGNFHLAQDSGNNDLKLNDGGVNFNLGQIDVAASGTMFYTLAYYDDIDGDANPDESHIKIYATDGNVAADNNKTLTEKNNVTILELYQKKNPGETKNKLTLDEYIKVSSISNAGDRVYLAIGKPAEGEIDVFQLTLDGVYNIQSSSYIATITEDFDKFDFAGVLFNDGAVDKEELVIATQKDEDIKTFCSYPLEGVKIFSQRGNTLTLAYKPANIGISLLWNAAMGTITPDLYVAIVEENKENAHIYNSKIDTPTDLALVANGEMNQTKCGDMNGEPFYIDQIELLTYYHSVDGIRLYVINGNIKGNEIFAYNKSITDAGNWIAKEISHSANEGIGRISGEFVDRGADDYRLMLVNPTPIVKHVTIVNQSTNANIEGIAYDEVQKESARSNLRPKISFEYTEEEIGGLRKVENISILEYNKNR